MRKSVSLGAVGNTQWVPMNYRQNPFAVSLAVDLDSVAAGITYEVQHTLDDLSKKVRPVSITRSATTVTVTFPTAHNKNVDDSIIVTGSDVTGMDGTYPIASVGSTTTLTYTSGTSATSTGSGSTECILLTVMPHEFLTAKTVADDGNYAFPVSAIRLNVSAHSTGKATLHFIQGGPQ